MSRTLRCRLIASAALFASALPLATFGATRAMAQTQAEPVPSVALFRMVGGWQTDQGRVRVGYLGGNLYVAHLYPTGSNLAKHVMRLRPTANDSELSGTLGDPQGVVIGRAKLTLESSGKLALTLQVDGNPFPRILIGSAEPTPGWVGEHYGSWLGTWGTNLGKMTLRAVGERIEGVMARRATADVPAGTTHLVLLPTGRDASAPIKGAWHHSFSGATQRGAAEFRLHGGLLGGSYTGNASSQPAKMWTATRSLASANLDAQQAALVGHWHKRHGLVDFVATIEAGRAGALEGKLYRYTLGSVDWSTTPVSFVPGKGSWSIDAGSDELTGSACFPNNGGCFSGVFARLTERLGGTAQPAPPAGPSFEEIERARAIMAGWAGDYLSDEGAKVTLKLSGGVITGQETTAINGRSQANFSLTYAGNGTAEGPWQAAAISGRVSGKLDQPPGRIALDRAAGDSRIQRSSPFGLCRADSGSATLAHIGRGLWVQLRDARYEKNASGGNDLTFDVRVKNAGAPASLTPAGFAGKIDGGGAVATAGSHHSVDACGETVVSFRFPAWQNKLERFALTLDGTQAKTWDMESLLPAEATPAPPPAPPPVVTPPAPQPAPVAGAFKPLRRVDVRLDRVVEARGYSTRQVHAFVLIRNVSATAQYISSGYLRAILTDADGVAQERNQVWRASGEPAALFNSTPVVQPGGELKVRYVYNPDEGSQPATFALSEGDERAEFAL